MHPCHHVQDLQTTVLAYHKAFQDTVRSAQSLFRCSISLCHIHPRTCLRHSLYIPRNPFFLSIHIRRNMYRSMPSLIYPYDLGQHRTIWQEHSAKDFASYESYKRAGILYVFPPFITARMGQKIGRRPQTQLCGDALVPFRFNILTICFCTAFTLSKKFKEIIRIFLFPIIPMIHNHFDLVLTHICNAPSFFTQRRFPRWPGSSCPWAFAGASG